MKNKYNELHIRIDDDELRILNKYKKFFETYSYTQIIRSFIRDSFCIKINYSADLEIATQIARIGNNINQIAKVANESGSLTAKQMETINDELLKVNNRVNALFKYRGEFIKYSILDGRDNYIRENILPDEYNENNNVSYNHTPAIETMEDPANGNN
ncbi:MAG TPA: hypothetical protein DEO83_00190 [Lachnospiraceae bacterium]|nr:hypothetical protein [Lachnospiraceae bacterium]